MQHSAVNAPALLIIKTHASSITIA